MANNVPFLFVCELLVYHSNLHHSSNDDQTLLLINNIEMNIVHVSQNGDTNIVQMLQNIFFYNTMRKFDYPLAKRKKI